MMTRMITVPAAALAGLWLSYYDTKENRTSVACGMRTLAAAAKRC